MLAEANEEIKDFDLVNYVLASALKADKIDPSDLGLIISYLEVVQAPPIYFQYAILRVHQNLSKVKLIDIAMTMANAFYLEDEDKIQKLIQRVQNYIEITNEKILAAGQPNLKGLMTLYSTFALYQNGTPKFFQKLESMIETDLSNKKYQLIAEEILPMLNALAIQRCSNEKIWQPLLNDLDKIIQLGSMNNMQIFYLLRSLSTVNLLDGDVTKTLVNYLVKRGYDSDDLKAMSSQKGGYRRAVHFISIVAESKPDLNNKHFLRHVEVFTKNCYRDMRPIQTIRLLKAL